MIAGITGGIISNLLTMIGVGAAKHLFGAGGASFEHTSDGKEPQDLGETPDFLAHQRFYYRLELAKAKWQWLKLATYYHPVAGRTARLPEDWDPRSISGHFTVADFAGRDLPHQSEIAEHSPSELRAQVLHNQITLVKILNNNIEAIEGALELAIESHRIVTVPWKYPEVRHAWISLMLEVRQKTFAELPNLNSYCGFKNLWSVIDTPVQGIRSRGTDTPNLFAYAALMEIAWYLSRFDTGMKELYEKNVQQKRHQLPHQEALRKLAAYILKTMWRNGLLIGPKVEV